MPDSADDRLLFNIHATSCLTKGLGISAKVLNADVRSLACSWETIAGSVDTPPSMCVLQPLVLLTALLAIASSYLRGHGLRMGNHRGFARHQFTHGILAAYVVSEVVSGGKYLFCALHRAGVTSMEDFANAIAEPRLQDIIEQARRILRGEERHDHE